jgi:hypothetical protein
MDLHKIPHWFALALVLSGTACGSSDMQSYTPIKEKTKIAPEVLFTASEQALESAGHVTTEINRENYTLETREKEVFVSSVPRLSYRYHYRVGTAGGVLTIDTACKQNSAMARTEYEDCGDERPGRLLAELNDIKKDILERAKAAK